MNIQEIPVEIKRKHANRYLTVVTFSDISAVLGEPLTVLYTNNMDAGAIAGNHYHRHKGEAFRAAHGRFEVVLVDIETLERQSIYLDSDPENPDFRCIVVPRGVAHAVRNVGTAIARLDVFATDEPRKESDDFTYEVLR